MSLAKPEVQRAFQNDLSDGRHGSPHGYKNLGCRCSRCGMAVRRQPSDRPYRSRQDGPLPRNKKSHKEPKSQNAQGAFEFKVQLAPFVPMTTRRSSGLTFHQAPFDPEAARGRAADAVAVVTGPHKGTRRTDGTEV